MIVGIEPHKLGPVAAVRMAAQHIDPDRPTVVNYCDFACYWDFADFASFVRETGCDGCVPAYRGFHPHSLGSTFYAYLRHEGLWMTGIREKQPFTDTPIDEFASSGTYYFRSGRLCLDAFAAQMEQDLSVGGEYYASLAFRVLAAWGRRTAIYELQHFMQWGTPQDLAEYVGWSNAFRRLVTSDGRQARHGGAILLPMAGMGQRFLDAGYALPKPLIPVSGRPMVIQAMRDLPSAPIQKFVLRKDLPGVEAIERKLRATFVGAQFLVLDTLTEGQAITARLGTEGLDPQAPLTIGACDNGILYDVDALAALLDDEGGADVLVWTVRGHADGQRRPRMFGWVEADGEGRVRGVRVKAEPDDPARDPLIIGTFTFRRLADFERAADALVARDGRVNGEFYVDSLIADCIALGLDVRIFEVDQYIGWGTPVDLRTFEYWQGCFHKWPGHPYRLEKDSRVPAVAIARLGALYAAKRAPRPAACPSPPIRRRAACRGPRRCAASSARSPGRAEHGGGHRRRCAGQGSDGGPVRPLRRGRPAFDAARRHRLSPAARRDLDRGGEGGRLSHRHGLLDPVQLSLDLRARRRGREGHRRQMRIALSHGAGDQRRRQRARARAAARRRLRQAGRLPVRGGSDHRL